MADGTRSTEGLWRPLLPALVGAGVVLPVGLALTFGMNVLLARALPVEGYGLFSYVLALVTVLSTVAVLGFSSSMMRFIAQYRASGELQLLRGLMTTSLGLICLASLLIGLGLMLLGWLVPGQRNALLWVAALLLPVTLASWRECAMRGLHRTSAALLPRQICLPLLMLLVLLLNGLNDMVTALAVFVGFSLLLELAGLVQLRQAFGFLVKIEPTRACREWMKVSLPMGMTGLLRQGVNRWDLVIVGALLGMSDAGIYAAAARTALLASLVLRVVKLAVGPMLAELYHQGDLRRFRQLLVASTAGSTLLGIPLYLLMLIRPEWVLLLFGSRYLEAVLPLQILATGQFISLIVGPVGLALTMTQYELTYLRLTLFASAASLVALALLVPPYGIVGAAIATASAVAALNLSTLMVAWQHFRTTP